eukprot:3812009-Rhodomonas_salina.4
MYGTDLAYAATKVLSAASIAQAATGSAPLSAYALATRYPVLRSRRVLSAYALTMRCPVLRERMMPPDYALAMRCPVLSSGMLLPGHHCTWTLYAVRATL